MNVEFGEHVECDLQAIARWLAQRNPAAAERLLDSFQDCCRFLAAYPHAGFRREDFAPDPVRCWPVTKSENYLILYRVHADHIEIWRVVHGARDFEKLRLE